MLLRLNWLSAQRVGKCLGFKPIGLLAVALACLGEMSLAHANDPAAALRERFIGAEGLPSETSYLQTQGLTPAPDSESFQWRAVFKLAYLTADLTHLADAEDLYVDCYFICTRRYRAPLRMQPVWDGRVYQKDGKLIVGGYTRTYGERIAGYVDVDTGAVRQTPVEPPIKMPDFSNVQYNPFSGQLWRGLPGGAIEEEVRYDLPLTLMNAEGVQVRPRFRVARSAGDTYSLLASDQRGDVVLATCSLDQVESASRTASYAPVLGSGCAMISDEPMTVVELPGKIADDAIDARSGRLLWRGEAAHAAAPATQRPEVHIDGRFDEWRNVPGVADPRGDVVSYLQYNPDADLLQFKCASDEEHLYVYTRVAGQHGRTAPGRDRYYFYVYIDADRDPATGYSPTRDDDCYYGVTLGDDCEAQYEFVGGRFVKTFYGFTGSGAETEVLAGKVELGPSWYSRQDEQGKLRDAYKVEYIRRAGAIAITEDFTKGTSDDIVIALSPDGSECEMRAALAGFLRDKQGKPLIAAGQRIDLAAGVEASGGAAGNSAWGADSTAVVYGYQVAE